MADSLNKENLIKSWVFVKDNNEQDIGIIKENDQKSTGSGEGGDSDTDGISVISEYSYDNNSSEEDINLATKSENEDKLISPVIETLTHDILSLDKKTNEVRELENINKLSAVSNQQNNILLYSEIIGFVAILIVMLLQLNLKDNNMKQLHENEIDEFICNGNVNYLGNCKNDYNVRCKFKTEIFNENYKNKRSQADEECIKKIKLNNIINKHNEKFNKYSKQISQLKIKENYLKRKEKLLLEREEKLLKNEFLNKATQKNKVNCKNHNKFDKKKSEQLINNKKKIKEKLKNHFNGEYNLKENSIKQYKKMVKKFDNKKHKQNITGQWYTNLYNERNNLRKRDHATDWIFERAHYRDNKRNKAYWYFQWMLNREHLRVKKRFRTSHI